MTTWNDVPAGAGGAERTPPAGDNDDQQRAAQRDTWRRVQASYRRGNRGGQHRRRAARGTLPAPRAGMIQIRRPPPDDAA